MDMLHLLKKGGGRALAGGIIQLLLIIAISLSATVFAQPPPDYSTFGRVQKVDYVPDKDSLLRIWIVNVGQGDGLIIQLPANYNYSVDGYDDPVPERTDILIDGGSWTKDESELIGQFIDRLYPDHYPIIEYTVITHHDKDHILGLTGLLQDTNLVFGTIYHNGLATYEPGTAKFPLNAITDNNAVYSKSGGTVTRGMAFLDSQDRIKGDYLVKDLGQLKSSFNNGYFTGEYEDLAKEIIGRSRDMSVMAFDRAYAGAPFIIENYAQSHNAISGIEMEVLWPLSTLQAYESRNWAKTINGNSVTFRLKYGQFEMLFTGDLNKASETELYNHLNGLGQLDKLKCDVLKVPHHGSEDVFEKLFTDSIFNPVVSAASMGESGFKMTGHKHPRPKVIDRLGGAHRFYSTYIHEKKFKWENMTEKKRQKMIEKRRKDILVETDGKWFRVVEITLTGDPNMPPPVDEVRRGHGTRWIRAD
ncbi:MAG: hypothetical protein CVT49_09540 [candidate division Zixibacteria bacterium HGW-Zixibacteria-1]|nr:MAG: hypothetical protein CVT49_09540 [candidate division Zixibacteria bacterium HGW-Zixibacteria-1]